MSACPQDIPAKTNSYKKCTAPKNVYTETRQLLWRKQKMLRSMDKLITVVYK